MMIYRFLRHKKIISNKFSSVQIYKKNENSIQRNYFSMPVLCLFLIADFQFKHHYKYDLKSIYYKFFCLLMSVHSLESQNLGQTQLNYAHFWSRMSKHMTSTFET